MANLPAIPAVALAASVAYRYDSAERGTAMTEKQAAEMIELLKQILKQLHAVGEAIETLGQGGA